MPRYHLPFPHELQGYVEGRMYSDYHPLSKREIEAGRDAANNLFMVAQEAGFLLAAAIFYRRYESLALKLLSWYPD